LAQKINYSDLNVSSTTLKNELLNSGNYFTNYPNDVPYFQGKTDSKYLKFYNSTGPIVTIDFKSQSEYLNIIEQIQKNANFRFKFCTDYDDNVVYNYQTSNGNKLRFNFNEMKLSVEYSSSTNKFLDSNFEFTPVFVCVSDNAYAYHTNLKCEGLGNCDAKIAKTNIKEAKKYNYKFCEICTSDNKSKTLLAETLKTTNTTEFNYDYSENDYDHDDESYNETKYETINNINSTNVNSDINFARLVEEKFTSYIPTILKSKGQGSEISHSEIHLGDLNNDGKEDAVLGFSFIYGGASFTYEEFAVYLNIDGQPKVVAGFEPNYRMSVTGIKNGLINVTKFDWQEGDGNCCPTLEIPIKLKLNGNKLEVWE